MSGVAGPGGTAWRLAFALQRVGGQARRLQRLVRRVRGGGEPRFELSPPLDDAQIESLYRAMVGGESFYDRRYAWQLSAHQEQRDAARDAARLLVERLRPRTALDVGCGTGELVARLRSLGVDAWGCDFSEAILRRSLRPVRPYLRREDVEDLGGHPDREFDLVSCMEVLEHLPERHVEETVAELRRIARGTVFITVPSFGPDVTGGYGLPMHDTWLEDARADRRFRRIVVGEDGRPHHGHLTLASHRWWTDLFLRHGLSRNNDIEAAMLRDRRRSLARWRLNPYVLHEVRGASWVAGESCVRQGVAGWHDLEQDPEGRAFRWTTERSTAVLLGGPAHQRLRLTVAGAPPSLVHDQAVELAVAPALGGGDAVRRTLEVPLGRWSEILVDGLSVAGGPVHVTLDVVRTFRPSRLPGGSADTRELGVMVSRMSLE